MLTSLATTGCEDSVDWLLDVAGAAGGAGPGVVPDVGSSNTSLSSNGTGGYTGTVRHGDGSALGNYGDSFSTVNIPGSSGSGGPLLSHGPVIPSPNFPVGSGFQGGPVYSGPQYTSGPPVQVQLSPVGGAPPTAPGQYYPRTSGGPVYQPSPSYPSSPPAFPQDFAAAPQAEPNPFNTGDAGRDPFAPAPPSNGFDSSKGGEGGAPADWTFGGTGPTNAPPDDGGGGVLPDAGVGGSGGPPTPPSGGGGPSLFGGPAPGDSLAGLGGAGSNGAMGLTGADTMGNVGGFPSNGMMPGGGLGMPGGMDPSTLS